MDNEADKLMEAADAATLPPPLKPDHQVAEGEGGVAWVEMAVDVVCGLLDL